MSHCVSPRFKRICFNRNSFSTSIAVLYSYYIAVNYKIQAFLR
nr:MAG TPA: hypothetical protein [Bacteriophage sp.]